MSTTICSVTHAGSSGIQPAGSSFLEAAEALALTFLERLGDGSAICASCQRGSVAGRLTHTVACAPGRVLELAGEQRTADAAGILHATERVVAAQAEDVAAEAADREQLRLNREYLDSESAAAVAEPVESDESWEAAAALNPWRRVVCGRVIAVFGFPGLDAFTCDLERGHGDAWHHDRTMNKIWLAEATEIHFHPNGSVETRLLGRDPEFDFSNATVAAR